MNHPCKLIFENKDVLRCVEHALAAPEHSMTYGYEGEPVPALSWVKDDGIYVMSNGRPHDLDERHTGPSEKCHVCYAKGYDPRTGDVWDKCRDAVGGDDFSEIIELTDQMVSDIRAGSNLILKVTSSNFEILTARYPAPNERLDVDELVEGLRAAGLTPIVLDGEG